MATEVDTSGERTVLPPSDTAAMLNLATFLEQQTEPAGLVGPDGQTVPLPAEVYEVLVQVAGAMLAGKAITVAPLEQPAPQQAADLLGGRRPTSTSPLSHDAVYELPRRGTAAGAAPDYRKPVVVQ